MRGQDHPLGNFGFVRTPHAPTTACPLPPDPRGPRSRRRTVRRVAKAAGIDKGVNPYDFRRTMVSLLSAADVAGNDAKTALSIYRHRMDPIVEDAVAPMDELFEDLGSTE